MFGLGAQEILLLACCATVPLIAAGIAFAVVRLSAKGGGRDDSGTTMDSDDPNQ